MAGLTETSTWENEIYQLEITDPVEGGSGGISNTQGRQLANRTKWLKDQIIELFRFSPKNRGYFSGLDIGGSVGSLSVSGNITSATASVPSAGDSIITINLANSMGNTNYKVISTAQSLGSDINSDNDVSSGVFKIISATQFQIGFREIGTVVQNLRVHIDVISLD